MRFGGSSSPSHVRMPVTIARLIAMSTPCCRTARDHAKSLDEYHIWFDSLVDVTLLMAG